MLLEPLPASMPAAKTLVLAKEAAVASPVVCPIAEVSEDVPTKVLTLTLPVLVIWLAPSPAAMPIALAKIVVSACDSPLPPVLPGSVLPLAVAKARRSTSMLPSFLIVLAPLPALMPAAKTLVSALMNTVASPPRCPSP